MSQDQEPFVPSPPLGDTERPDSPIVDSLPQAPTVPAAPGFGSCMYEGKEYSNGSEICAAKRVLRCFNGTWLNTGRPC